MNDRLLYFSTGDGADLKAEMLTVPIHRVRGIFPVGDTVLTLKFEADDASARTFDYVRLTITTDTHKAVTSSINDAINNNGKGMILICDKDNSSFVDSNITDCSISYATGSSTVKILPSDFIADDGGRPLAIDDTTSDRWLESNGTNPMFASVEIPIGFKATHVDVYGSATSAVTVYEADVNSATVTSKGTGNIGTQINITDVTADATNYIMIELVQASGERVYGGKLTIAKV